MATIKSKIILNVCIVIVIVIGIVGVISFDLRHMGKLQDESDRRSRDAILATAADGAGRDLYACIADAIINRNLADSQKRWAADKERALKLLADLSAATDTPEEKEAAAKAQKAAAQIVSLYEGKLLPLLEKDNSVTDEIRGIDGEIDGQIIVIHEATGVVQAALAKEMKAVHEEFSRAIRNAITQASIIGIAGILLQAGLAGWLIRQVLKPVNAMVLLLKDVAEGEGDLTKRLDDSSKDEIAVASGWFNQFIGKVQQIITEVGHSATQLASAATQLHATSEQIATGAEEVAAQTGTVATASEEMAATSADIAQNCHLAADSASQASRAAAQGAAVVENTVQGMRTIAIRVQETARTVEALGARSDQIGAIIETIGDIADQTNLLALNAAIEAARAGEQGRGFAVVADEVRALAERTTRATKEIGDMIKAIQKETQTAVSAMEEGVDEVAKGTAEAEKSGKVLAEILDQITSVNQQIAQVATAAEEQTATTNDITNNIQQMSEVVEVSAKGAMESSDAAASVNRLADELNRLVSRFRT